MHRPYIIVGILCLGLAACAEPDPPSHRHGPLETQAGQGLSVEEVSGCSLAAVRGLDEQIVEEMNCISPGTLASFEDLDIELSGSSTWPLLQPAALEAFARAVASRGQTFRVNSAYRTIVQQYLLYQWYLQGRCGISLAAQPGRSNHQSGLALDVSDHAGWRPFLEAEGWDWLGSSDPVHFDYRGTGTRDIRDTAVLAFQRLWNRNHGEDLIDEDGLYGPQTESRLQRSPPEGFDLGADCASDPDPEPEPEPDPEPEPEVEPGSDDAVTVEASLSLPAGQASDLFEVGSSQGIEDLVEGRTFEVSFTVRNGAERTLTDEVIVGFEVSTPFLSTRAYTVESDFPALDGRSFIPSDAEGSEDNPPLDSPGDSGLMNLLVLSPGESKRLTLSLEAAAYSLSRPEHAHVRMWLVHAGGYYGEMESWEDEAELNLAQEPLRRQLLLDVFSPNHWPFEGQSTEDTEGWSPCNEGTALNLDVPGQQLVAGSVAEVCAESPPWTSIDPLTYPGYLLEIGAETGVSQLELQWRREGEDWSSASAARFELPPGRLQLALDMSGDEGWAGTIEGLRLVVAAADAPSSLIVARLEPLTAIPEGALAPATDEAAPPAPTSGERSTHYSEGCAVGSMSRLPRLPRLPLLVLLTLAWAAGPWRRR